MKIAIIVAMQKELHLLLGRMGKDDVQLVTVDSHPYYIGTLAGHEIVATVCGIGKVNAALTTDSAIRNFKPDLVINTGVAGGVGAQGVGVLDVIVADAVAYHDVWCGPGTPIGEANGCPARFTPALEVVSEEVIAANPRVKKGLICSGDIFVSKVEEVATIRKNFPEVMAVDMESAAIMHTCFKHGIPAIVVRVISDTPGDADNIAQYEDFWEDAPRESMDTLVSIINELKK